MDPEKVIPKEELRKYMFPCLPLESWIEHVFTEKLDGCRSTYDSNSQVHHVTSVSNRLEASIEKECCQSKTGKCQSKHDTIKIGNPLDAKSLLFPPSRKGCYLVRRRRNFKVKKIKAKDVDLSGKYVMLCCFMVPLSWNISEARRVAVACHDLYSKMKNQFEMVIVAIMRDGWTHDKKAFTQFMSAFPPSCLAIPFHAKSHRHCVCKYLGGMFMGKITLVAPTGNVLFHDEIPEFIDLEFVPWYHLANSHPFPFITDADAELHLTIPSSLEDLLYSSDFVFRKHPLGVGCEATFRKEKLPIFQLKSKLVALYLCTSGHLLPWLRKIEQACWQSDKELEIVVVHISDWFMRDPHRYTKFLSNVLAKRNISWWVAPYNNTTSIIHNNLFDGEKVIIVGPNGSYVDTYGAELMQLYGIAAYPFTVKHVVQKTVAELSKVTLDLFLELLNMRLEYHHHIGKKNMLFYFDNPFTVNSVVYEAYMRFTFDTDVVILPFSISEIDDDDDSKQVRGSNLSWYNTCVGACNVADKFFMRFFSFIFPTIVAFGKDGSISSLLAHRLPYSQGDKSFPVKGDLLEEVSSLLDESLTMHDCDGQWRFNLMEDFEELHELRQSWA